MSNLPAVFSTSQTLRKILQDAALRNYVAGHLGESSSQITRTPTTGYQLLSAPCALHPVPCTLYPVPCNLSPCLPAAHSSNQAPPFLSPRRYRRILPSCRKPLAKDASTSPFAAGATRTSRSTSSASGLSSSASRASTCSRSTSTKSLAATASSAPWATPAEAPSPTPSTASKTTPPSKPHSAKTFPSPPKQESPTSSLFQEIAAACPTTTARAIPSSASTASSPSPRTTA